MSGFLGDDDDAPTPRESGSLAIFATTCEEAIARLAGDTSERADELRVEGHALIVEIQGWANEAPAPEARASAVSRVMELHRASLEATSRAYPRA